MQRPPTRLGRLLAEREYKWRFRRTKGTLQVRIGVPRVDPQFKDTWVCTVELAGGPEILQSPHPHAIYGVDALQSLQLALFFLHGQLALHSAAFNLTWHDRPELGFEGIQLSPAAKRAVKQVAKLAAATRRPKKRPEKREARPRKPAG